MSTDTRGLVAAESSTAELLSGGLVALSLLLVAGGLVGLLDLVPMTATVGGLAFATLQGAGLAAPAAQEAADSGRTGHVIDHLLARGTSPDPPIGRCPVARKQPCHGVKRALWAAATAPTAS